MPLSANVSGVKAVASFCSDECWQEIKDLARSDRGEVTMDCCGHPAVPRKSPLGTRHFAHRPKADCLQPGESVHHIFLKEALIKALTKQGFTAEPEFRGDDWRADVMARRGIEQVIFEVQWTNQSAEQTLKRSERYAQDGYHTVWLQRAKVDNHMHGSGRAPCFQVVNPDKGQYHVLIGGQELTVDEFIDAWAEGKMSVRSSEPMNAATIHGYLVDLDCDQCGQPAKAVAAHYPPLEAYCGLKESLPAAEHAWLRDPLTRALLGRTGLEEEAEIGRLPPMSFKLSERSTFTQFCVSCGGLLSNSRATSRLKKLFREGKAGEPIFKFSEGGTYDHNIIDHWCLNVQCEEGGRLQPSVEKVAEAVQAETSEGEIFLDLGDQLATRARAMLALFGEATSKNKAGGGMTDLGIVPESEDLNTLSDNIDQLAGKRGLLYIEASDDDSERTIWARRLDGLDQLTIIAANRSGADKENLKKAISGELVVVLGQTEVSFGNWLDSLLLGEGNNRSDYLHLGEKQKGNVYAARSKCWRCDYRYEVLEVDGVWLSCCGKEVADMSIWQEAVGPKVYSALENKQFYANASLAKRNFSSHEYEDQLGKIWVNVCPSCQATFGPLFLGEAHEKAAWYGNRRHVASLTIKTSKVEVDRLPSPLDHSHYCPKGCADRPQRVLNK